MTDLFKQSINLTLPILLVLLLGTPTQATANIDTTALVGSTAGSFSVNQGTANYTIPLTVPLGIAGMKPELSINYNSSIGNGQLGVGFSLSGSFAIHRCAKTIATDGVKGGINYDNNDRYCLNGQRLITISGTDGQSGSEYRTEMNSFRKIKYNGNYWTVKTKSGQTFEYGNTQDSKIEAQGKSVVRLWSVNKIIDATGNAISYVYNENNANGEYTLSSINYADSLIGLTYEGRSDVSTSYQAGSKLRQTKRLSNITTYVNNNIVRTYDLEYQYYSTPKKSQLISIKECVNGQCLPKTEFDWQKDIDNSWQVNAIITDICANESGNYGVCNDDDNYKHIRFIDMNSDGKSDLVYRSDQGIQVHYSDGTSFNRRQSSSICANESRNHGVCNDSDNYNYMFYTDVNGDGNIDICNRADLGIRCHINTGTSWQENAIVTDICANESGNYGVCNDDDNYTHIRFIDMNSDGKSDLVYRGDQGIQVYYSDGTSFNRRQSSSICANESRNHGVCNDSDNYNYMFYTDVNGDGNIDICNRADLGIRCHINTGTSWQENAIVTDICANESGNYGVCNDDDNYTHIRFIDMNSDGKSDLVYRGDQGIQVYYSDGTSFNRRQSSSICANESRNHGVCNDSDNYNYMFYTDVNGDGNIDICNRADLGIRCHINTGTSWQENAIVTDICANESGNYGVCNDDDNYTHIRFIDMNSDGKSDLVYRGDQGIQVYYSDGTSFNRRQSSSICANESRNHGVCNDSDNYNYMFYTDVNGDGNMDICNRADLGIRCHDNAQIHSKLRSITNGFNIKTIINYKPLTNPSVYTKGTNGNYPNIDTQNARQVVSSVVTDNAIGGQSTTTYKYGNAKVNIKGRGSLGFGWIEKKDLQSNKLTRTQYNQTYPHVGQIAFNKEYIEQNGSRQLLNSQTNIYQDKISHNNKIHTSYLTQSQEKSYDFNSGNLLTTITTQQSNIDNYGNIGTVKVTTTGKNETFIKTTQNTYNNNTTKWHLGRLTAATVTHQAPNTPNITRTSHFTYNNKGLLKSEIIEPNTAKALTTTYEYDSFGNKIKATTSANGITNRSTTTEYSTNGKFPIKTTNALGHSETKTFDSKTGNILTLTGPNGLTTTWQYDALGRKKLEVRTSTTTSTHYQWAEDDSPNSLYKVITTTNGSSPKTTYFDAFNRKVREQHTGFDGRKINSDTYYDNLGRVNRATLPYFTDEQGYFITTQYDAIGRLTSITKPADYGKTATDSTTYNGFTTISTNALGHQKTTTKNAIGKIIRIDEPESAWLIHTHDAIGNLIQTNAGGVTTTMTYDNRGNKISMNDPDMGNWTYTYNALGELISQTDAKKQTSTMTYDKLGRMTQRVEGEGTTNWIYDTQTKGIGKLTSVTAPLGYKKEYHYDNLGRVSKTTTRANNQSFNIRNQYDQYSRLSIQTRPQGFKVENVYNQYGYLIAKRAPKSQVNDYDWTHLTQLTQQSLTNATEASTRANESEERANLYLSRANTYRQYANSANNTSAQFTKKAQALRNNADLLEEVASQLQKKAKSYTDSSKAYLIAVRRFQHLSNVNVTNNKARSYIDSNTNSKIGDRSFSDTNGNINAKSNTNGYAWCSNQAACVYWANSSRQNAAHYANQAEQTLELAQKYINSSGTERQTFANQEAGNYDQRARSNANNAVHYTNKSHEYLEQAQKSINQAKYWRKSVVNKNHYQAMLADTNNIYFWRAKSRDAAGRLTGHIIGNGLSTEQEYNPATGHLFTIKSGFSPTREIRSLEYEYDLMNNVTQRQNHQSGLTEDFQYDQLDRLTQSNTTGTIEGVTYNNSTNFQYDISGNITHKSDIGNYRYNAQKPHAIASINNNPSSTSSPSTDDYNANTTTTGMFTINSSVTGDIETVNDKDWFKITLTAGQQVTFDLGGKPTQSGTLSDPYLRGIYDNTGTLISNTTSDDGGIGSNSKVTFTANTSNTYYISAGAYSNNTGTYTLTATVTGSNANITPNPSDNYLYDANGNMTQNNHKLIQWTSFNKPKRFTNSNSNDTTTFAYAPNRNRYQKTQTKANSNTTITTTYIGKLYEQIKQNTNTEHKHFIYADGQLIAINIKTNTTANTPSIPDKTRYLHYDNLGSIDTITDGQGNIVERMAYTAFGQRRQGDWRASDPLLPIIPTLTNRGFTGHEHIDEMGFIHMNGRVYDPQIGRFLSADPTIQHPYNTQDYNRYSYATNNPLKYVDMNGFGWFSKARRNIAKFYKKYGRQIASIGVLFIPGVNIYAAGFLSGMIGSKGDLKQGALGAFTAGFNAGVLHPMKAGFGKLIAHGLTGGIRSRLSGGSFKSGFLGSAISYSASWSGAYEAAGVSSQAVTWGQRAQNVVASYVVGGVAAELGGGKFKNGGMSAAFSRMFNDTLTMSGSLRIPTWIQKALGIDVPMQSLGGGFALSYPGFGNDEWDLGLYGQIALGGVDIGIGKATLDFGWQTGSVSSINGTGGNIGAHYGMYGASMTTGNNGNINGFNVHVGPGYNASATGTMNGSCSIRHWSCSN